ncbi:unnamed protein product [Prorocentrum cordatum]|uniref:Uncharacterized protein n=1 Tax=Prorocentrum cordatum TaxID=2364126 RepID=A0ABN9SHE0_9DINO|nr:unnamed protein product [Polarella glacialis]
MGAGAGSEAQQCCRQAEDPAALGGASSPLRERGLSLGTPAPPAPAAGDVAAPEADTPPSPGGVPKLAGATLATAVRGTRSASSGAGAAWAEPDAELPGFVKRERQLAAAAAGSVDTGLWQRALDSLRGHVDARCAQAEQQAHLALKRAEQGPAGPAAGGAVAGEDWAARLAAHAQDWASRLAAHAQEQRQRLEELNDAYARRIKEICAHAEGLNRELERRVDALWDAVGEGAAAERRLVELEGAVEAQAGQLGALRARLADLAGDGPAAAPPPSEASAPAARAEPRPPEQHERPVWCHEGALEELRACVQVLTERLAEEVRSRDEAVRSVEAQCLRIQEAVADLGPTAREQGEVLPPPASEAAAEPQLEAAASTAEASRSGARAPCSDRCHQPASSSRSMPRPEDAARRKAYQRPDPSAPHQRLHAWRQGDQRAAPQPGADGPAPAGRVESRPLFAGGAGSASPPRPAAASAASAPPLRFGAPPPRPEPRPPAAAERRGAAGVRVPVGLPAGFAPEALER